MSKEKNGEIRGTIVINVIAFSAILISVCFFMIRKHANSLTLVVTACIGLCVYLPFFITIFYLNDEYDYNYNFNHYGNRLRYKKRKVIS